MQIRKLITNVEKEKVLACQCILSPQYLHQESFFYPDNDIDLPSGFHGRRTTTWESRGYRRKYDCFTPHSQGDLSLKLVPDEYKALRSPHYFFLCMVSFKTQNHMRKEKSGFSVEGIQLMDAFGNAASAHKQSSCSGDRSAFYGIVEAGLRHGI